ncbi:MAG: SMR family transporter [Acidovorax sp.]|uniref:SMR family transporter n=1 Tax=Acidovorax sp. TaxID=1872122 RepID=UPI00391AE9B0
MNALPASSYLLLGLAIAAEVLGTSALKASDGFTRLAPSLITVVAYGVSFYLLSLTLKSMPIGIAYAVWSGVGIVLISAIGWLLYGQRLDAPALIGLGLIVAGVLVVNLFSKSAGH